MRHLAPCLVVFGLGCALNAEVAVDRGTPSSGDHCAAPPNVAPGKFRKLRNRMFAGLGDPRHRGIDVIAMESDPAQTVAGKLAYTAADKDLGGELVSVYACIEDEWTLLGEPLTDGNGRFAIELTGSVLLPAGRRDLYAHVNGDGSGVRFLAYVAKPGEKVIVTDIDGTITASENAVFNTVLFGDDIGHRIGAPEALAETGHTIVYLSSRGDQLSDVTRRWLRQHGFPNGPLRLAPASITKPGPRTVAYKSAVLRALRVPIDAAIGNKPTDVQSYVNAGVPATRIFVKLPEFESALGEDLAARRAIGFNHWNALPALLR
jgi:hypothetical protein